MKTITGKYVCFVDSDDWIEVSMLEMLYNLLIIHDCDISSCGIKMVWEDNRPFQLLCPFKGCHVLEDKEYALECLISNHYLVQTVWNKLYKTETIKEIDFPEGKNNEDEYWSWRAIANANKIVCLDTPMYNYLQRSGSIMRGSNFNPMFALEAHCIRYEYVTSNFPKLQDMCCEKLLYTCLFQAQRAKLLLNKKQYRTYYKPIRQIVKEHKPRIEYMKSLCVKKRIRISSIYHFFGVVCFVQNALGIGNKTNIV